MRLATLTYGLLCMSIGYGQIIDCTDPHTQIILSSPVQQLEQGHRMSTTLQYSRAISDRPIARESFAAQVLYTLFKTKANRFSVGIQAAQRTIGSNNFGIKRLGLIISDEQLVGKQSILLIGVGAYGYQAALSQNSLRWGDQYGDDGYDHNIATLDALNLDPGVQLDFAAGIGFQLYLKENARVPQNDQYISVNLCSSGFLNPNSEASSLEFPSGSLQQLHLSARLKAKESLFFGPMIRVQHHGSSTSALVGTDVAILRANTKVRGLSRIQSIKAGLYLDTRRYLVQSIGLQYGPMSVGYDLRIGLFPALEDQRLPSSNGIRLSYRMKEKG